MDHETASVHLAETMQHLCRYWESRRQPEGAKKGRRPFTIAISREAGTQGTAIATEAGDFWVGPFTIMNFSNPSPRTWACGQIFLRAWMSETEVGSWRRRKGFFRRPQRAIGVYW